MPHFVTSDLGLILVCAVCLYDKDMTIGLDSCLRLT